MRRFLSRRKKKTILTALVLVLCFGISGYAHAYPWMTAKQIGEVLRVLLIIHKGNTGRVTLRNVNVDVMEILQQARVDSIFLQR